MLLKKPQEVGWVEAGGIPENWMTGELSFSMAHLGLCLKLAYQALFLEGGMQKGQNVLIHAVGTYLQ